MKEGVVNRIKQVMEYYQMNAAVFAGEIGVQRSSISHIISGRNKPSLDMVQRVLEKFTKVNSEWMLFGKGDMLDGTSQVNLFDGIDNDQDQDSQNSDITNEDQTSVHQSELATGKHEKVVKPINSLKPPQPVTQIEQKPVKEEKEVEKIIVFYKDGTFKMYLPE